MINNSSEIIDGVINGDIKTCDIKTVDFREVLPGELKDIYFDDGITEIMINGSDVHIEKNGAMEQLGFKADPAALQRLVENISQHNNKNIDYNHPIFDGKLPDGSRCNVVIPPVALRGLAITIRKHNKSMHSLRKLTEQGMFTLRQKEIITEAVRTKENIIISGGTGSGKTTLINALLNSLTDLNMNERVITIEDTAELAVELPHVVGLECRFPTPDCPMEVSIRDLVKTALRMRPDRIIIGEIRGCEAYDLLHALNTGHNGMMCTIHSNSCRDSLRRLETLAILGHGNLDINIPRNWIAGNIDLLIHVEKQNGSRKVLEIKRIEGIECNNYVLADI